MMRWRITVSGSTMREIREAAESEFCRFFESRSPVPIGTLDYEIVGRQELTTIRKAGGAIAYEQSEIHYTAEVTERELR